MNLNDVPILHPDTIWRVLEDGAVVVTPRAGNVRVLNSVGTTIWQLINGENSLADIERQLVLTFDVPPERARADLLGFIEELERRDMIRWQQAPASG